MATTLFSDLAARVLIQLGNRSDQTTNAQNAVADAVIDLCSGGDDVNFEELEVTGPNFNFTANVDTYAVSDTAGTTGGFANGVWLNTGDVLQMIMDIIVYTDAAPTNTSATNRSWIRIKDYPYQRINEISPFSTTWPTLRARRNAIITGTGATAKSTPCLFFRNIPNDAWTSYMNYRKMHPLEGTYPYSGTGFILPFEWQKVVVDLATAIVWNGPLKEHDRANALFLQLGRKLDDETGKPIPGLIQRLSSKRNKEYPAEEQHMAFRQEGNNPC